MYDTSTQNHAEIGKSTKQIFHKVHFRKLQFLIGWDHPSQTCFISNERPVHGLQAYQILFLTFYCILAGDQRIAIIFENGKNITFHFDK